MQAVVDIVFLMDATGSMSGCIQRLKDNTMLFFRALAERSGSNIPPLKDWRAKVVGFRDYEYDGATDWFVDNPFTRDIGELERQLDSLEAIGGGDAPESLLDAMYTVMSAPKSERGIEAPWMWRERHEAKRAVVIFTDAPFKPVMVAPGCCGGTIDDVRNICVQERIQLTVVAPSSEQPEYECFDCLGDIRKANYIPIPPALSTGDSSLDRLLDNFQNVIQSIAKRISND